MSLFQQLLVEAGGLSRPFTQHARLIRLHTVLGADALLAERVEIDECLSPSGARASAGAVAGFRIVVHALSPDTHLELKALIGQPVLVELLTAQGHGSLRPFHGHITQATLVGSDNGLARYRLVAEPWLNLLAHRIDSWVFQGQTVMQILDEVFADHVGQGRLMPVWRWELADASVYPARSLCVQYQESDLAFVERLLREEGLFYWFEHGGQPLEAGTLGQHTLVIADHNGAFRPNAQPRVRFTQSSAVLPEDSLTEWHEHAELCSATLHLASMDYRSLSHRPVSQASLSCDLGLVHELALTDVPGAYAYEDNAQGERLALRRMQALDAQRFVVTARGTVRTSAPGTTFMLVDHDLHEGRDPEADEFVMLGVRHRARSNLSPGSRAQLDRLLGRVVDAAPSQDTIGAPEAQASDTDEPLYECELSLQPAQVPVRLPGSAALNPRPTIHGSQTALVVGLQAEPGDSPIHTDRDHRIKVQFHWQRGDQASHRLAPQTGSNAPGTDAASTWVRVSQRVAGTNWGANFIPRVGHEVLVQFIGGDIDRPVVVGSLYNGQGQAEAQGNQVAGGAAGSTGNANAWFPGHGHAAVHAGFKTQELATSAHGAGGYNQLVLDDTPRANRVELSTTQAHTRLQLGHLIQQQDNQRLSPRGHGLDLESAAWGAVRAGSGLLLSAHARPASVSAAQQMDAREPRAQLTQAQDLLHRLADSAQAHRAVVTSESAAASASGTDSAAQLPAAQGLHSSLASLSGTREAEDTADAIDAGEADGQRPGGGGIGAIAAWQRPDLVMAAPAGVGHFTPATAVWSAGTTVSLVANGDINQMAQASHATSAKEGVVMFTYGKANDAERPNTETGIKLHAASGRVQTQSQSAATRITAAQGVGVASTADSVKVGAPQHVLLTTAGAAIRLEGGNITVNGPGKVEFKAGQKVLTGPGVMSLATLNFPRSYLDLKESFVYPVSI